LTIYYFVADAEIYEVHPQTRVRITTRTPKTTQTTLAPSSADFFTNVEYDETTVAAVFEESASTVAYGPIVSTESVNEDSDQESLFGDIVADDEQAAHTTQKAFEASTVNINLSTTTASNTEVHETADKHSTFAPDAIPLEAELEVIKEEVLASSLDLDIQNEIGVDQEFEESQQVQQAWNDLTEPEDKVDKEDTFSKDNESTELPVVVASTPNSRLTSYEKNIDTSLFSASDFSSGSSGHGAETIGANVNEHGQQQVEAGEVTGEDVTSLRPEVVDAWRGLLPQKSYVEIDRSVWAKPTASVEEVPITESKDYTEPDVFYDINKEGFEDTTDAKDVYSFPVSVKLNLPEVTTVAATSLQPILSEEIATAEAVAPTEAALTTAALTTIAATTLNNYALPSTTADTTVVEQSRTTTAFVQPSTSTAITASPVVTTNVVQTQFQVLQYL